MSTSVSRYKARLALMKLINTYIPTDRHLGVLFILSAASKLLQKRLEGYPGNRLVISPTASLSMTRREPLFDGPSRNLACLFR